MLLFHYTNQPIRASFSWGIRIWNWKWHGINYLTSKWPFDLTCLNVGSKLMLLFHYKKTTYPGQFFMRNSNLKSKIARDQLFDLKVTFWPDIPTSGQVNIRSKCMFSFATKQTYPAQFCMRNSNLKYKTAWHLLFDLEVTFWPDIANCQVKTHSKLVFLFHNKNQTIRNSLSREIRIWNRK